MAVTAQALSGSGGMPGLLWSSVWLADVVTSDQDCPNEMSFSDTIPLTEIRPIHASCTARMKLRIRQTLVPSDRAA